jgi:hypothetical protein
VPSTGGLKLRLESSKQEDRRTRFAQVTLSVVENARPILLVTDARGRMRYRLADGEYQLSLIGVEPVRFSVRQQRWTLVRVPVT